MQGKLVSSGLCNHTVSEEEHWYLTVIGQQS
uniref:Uncharacterized protein n=1 Tax=Anguilla anguilla TaxID=7936 RepID=A0A0E9TQX7_ANGAN